MTAVASAKVADERLLRILDSLNKLDLNVESHSCRVVQQTRRDSVESDTTAREETPRSAAAASEQLESQ